MTRMLLSLLMAALLLATGAAAQAPGASGRAMNTNAPVQISADSLEVQQDNQIATFKGKVEASQDDMRLKADLVRVYYADKSKSGGEPAGGNDNSSISRIEAVGRVFISRPDQTAQGDRGTYDLDKRVIVLEGNVIITDKDNVIRGNKATMDLEGKQSVVEQGPGGRVQGVFQPQKKSP